MGRYLTIKSCDSAIRRAKVILLKIGCFVIPAYQYIKKVIKAHDVARTDKIIFKIVLFASLGWGAKDNVYIKRQICLHFCGKIFLKVE